MSEQTLLDPQEWIAEHQNSDRDIFLTIDRLAEPDPVIQLFQLDLMQEYANLYAGTNYDALKDVGPWLIKIPAHNTQALSFLLDSPQQNWGWLASADKLEMTALTTHWRERMLIEQQGARALYRFQDNRVIAHHLTHLTAEQRPILMGPLHSVLCWNQGAWAAWVNPEPVVHPAPVAMPWVAIPEPDETANAVRQHNLQQWLWENHPSDVTRLVEQEELQGWVGRQLETARNLSWDNLDQQRFLLQHQLNRDIASLAVWAPFAGETPADHYERCFNALKNALPRSY